MSNFEQFFDEVKSKAKSAADFAGKKTNELVEVGKAKYEAKRISWEIEKVYAKIGAIVYEAKKHGEGFDDLIDGSIEELDALHERLEELEDEVRDAKAASAAGVEREPDAPAPVEVKIEVDVEMPKAPEPEEPTE